MIKKINKNTWRLAFIVTLLGLLLLGVTSCGGKPAITYKTLEDKIQTVQLTTIKDELMTYVVTSGITNEVEKNQVDSLVYQKVNTLINNNNITSDVSAFLDNAFVELEAVSNNTQITYKDKNSFKEVVLTKQLNAARNEALVQIDNYVNIEKLESHQQELINKAKTAYKDKLSTATHAKLAGALVRKSGSSCTGATAQSVSETEFQNAVDVYQIVFFYTIQADRYRVQPAPMQFYGFNNGFWSHLFNNFFTYPVGWVLWTISKLFGGLYVVGLIITTLLVRTIGWPIYAKTNDMSLKMQIMQPDLAKLEAKYENRKDPESQRAKQMEMAQIYRKYKVGIGGCIMPFLQFPIFMSIFRAITRIPYTDGSIVGTANWTKDLNTTLFGIDLFKDRNQGGSWQMWGIIILAVLVVATQIISQIMMQVRQKQAQQQSQEDIPAYRRQAAAQANETQKTMKYMMYFMTIMMAMFVLSSAAGLGFYWLIGNLYSMAQTYFNQNMSVNRLNKLKEKHGR